MTGTAHRCASPELSWIPRESINREHHLQREDNSAIKGGKVHGWPAKPSDVVITRRLLMFSELAVALKGRIVRVLGEGVSCGYSDVDISVERVEILKGVKDVGVFF